MPVALRPAAEIGTEDDFCVCWLLLRAMLVLCDTLLCMRVQGWLCFWFLDATRDVDVRSLYAALSVQTRV
jgi:hypothetical protein